MMEANERHIAVWNDCLHLIEQLVEPAAFKTWFEPIRPVSLVESKLTIEVPTDFFREYLESAFLDELRMALKRVIGPEAKLTYMVRPVTGQSAVTLPSQDVATPKNPEVSFTSGVLEPKNAYVIPGLRRMVIDPHLNPAYSFANIVQGDCNRMGITAGETISASPGNTPFNPLFIFGGPGLGKTHLAQAIGLSIKERFPDKVVLYISGHEFKMQFVDAVIVKNKLNDFIAFYQKLDVLIVDDIQDLMGTGCQGAFFSVFNSLHQNGKQLIFTSDRAPADLQNFEQRLLSRFKWGLSVQLTAPDYKTRLEMLRARAAREGVIVPDDVLEYIATRVRTSFRELEGSLVSLILHASVERGKSMLELAEGITENLVGEEAPDIDIEKVQRTVCDYFNISREELVSKSRRRQIVQARQIAMYLSRNLISNCSLATIGLEIGGKDHATVLHACNTVSDLMSTDKVFKKYVTDIEAALAPSSR